MEKKKIGIVSIITIAILGIIVLGTLGLLAFGFLGAMTAGDGASAAGWFIFVVMICGILIIPYYLVITIISIITDLCAKNPTIKTVKDIIVIILLIVPVLAFLLLALFG